MYIDDFVWLTKIANKIASKHRVVPDEVEEVFFNTPRYRFVESGHRSATMYTRQVDKQTLVAI